MARIRIVDEWLRSPVSPPARQRAIFVVARSWAEQRVLMRAFSSCGDQTRPTIHLHGAELAIGPAGTDPHGAWGIHVEPPVDGRAQAIRQALEVAARRLVGSKGTPARLQDEAGDFDIRATNYWQPEDSFRISERTKSKSNSYYEPAVGAEISESGEIPSSAQFRAKCERGQIGKNPRLWCGVFAEPELRKTDSSTKLARVSTPPISSAEVSPVPVPKRRGVRQTARYLGAGLNAGSKRQERSKREKTSSRARKSRLGGETVLGFSSAKRQGVSYAAAAGKTMPLGIHLDREERALLSALAHREYLRVSEIGKLLQVAEPAEWMLRFIAKLENIGLDLVAPGEIFDGEASYRLAR